MKKRYGSKGPTANGYLRSNDQSKFHGGMSSNVAEASVVAKGDNDSEASILPNGQSRKGIRQTHQVTVEYGANSEYPGYGEAIEMDSRAGRQP